MEVSSSSATSSSCSASDAAPLSDIRKPHASRLSHELTGTCDACHAKETAFFCLLCPRGSRNLCADCSTRAHEASKQPKQGDVVAVRHSPRPVHELRQKIMEDLCAWAGDMKDDDDDDEGDSRTLSALTSASVSSCSCTSTSSSSSSLSSSLPATVSDSSSSSTSNTASVSDRRCTACGAHRDKLLLCGACKQVWYCDVKCQRADWKIHSPLCARIRDMQSGSYGFRVLFASYLLVRQ